MIKKYFVVLALALVAALSPLAALSIKIGTVAPVGSPWDVTLHELSGDWQTISKGQVDLRIYAGGIAGDEMDLIRKMRIGQLQGAALTQLALGTIVPELLSLDTPFLVRDDGELNYLMTKMRPYFEQRFLDQGYRLLTWTSAGWVHFFARSAIITPDDLRKLRLGVPDSNGEFIDVWKTLGYNAIGMPITDILAGLQAGRLDAFYAPPSAAAVFQWFLTAAHMTSIRIAPLIVAFIVDERAWKRVPAELQEPLIDAVHGGEGKLMADTLSMDDDAIHAMQKSGLTVDTIGPDATKKWQQLGSDGANVVVGRVFSREIYEQVVAYLADYRKVHGE